MKKLLKFAGLLVASAAIAAHAAPASASTFTKPEVQKMIDMLEVSDVIRSYGVSINVVDNCKEEWAEGSFIHGRKPTIEICSNNMSELTQLQHALQHEAVHMAQWCHGSDSVYVVSSIKKNSKFKDDIAWADKMARHYEKSDYDSEFEAYYYMDLPQKEMVEMLHDNCK